MRKRNILSALASISYHSGFLRVFRQVGNFAQIRRDASGCVSFPYLDKRKARNFQILTYHRLTHRQDPFFPGLLIGAFEQQVEYLARYHQVVELGQLLRSVEAGDPIPPNAVSLTFDDGYRDNYELVFPILRRFGIPATIFLTTGFLDGRDVLWNDKVCFALKHTKRTALSLDGQAPRRYGLETKEERLRAADEILWHLRHIPHAQKLEIIEHLLCELEIGDFASLQNSMLTWEQVHSMHRQGIMFGSHTVNHPNLTRIPLAEARDEVLISKMNIEEHLGCAIDLFAFPAGTTQDYSPELKNLLRDVGYKAAVTTVFGTNTAETDRFELRRNWTLEDANAAAFAARILWYKFSQ